MALAQFRMLINELMKKYPDAVTEYAPIITLDIKSAMCMENNDTDTKPTIQIYRRMYFVRNGEECNMHKIVWCEGGLQLVEIGTKNVKEDELNTGLEYTISRLYN